MPALRHHCIGGKALQPPDLHRLALCRLAHTDLFAQRLGWADPRAHAAQNVLPQNRARRRLWRAGRDLADEQGDVDRGGAGRHTGRIKAEIAAIRRHPRLVRVQGRRHVRKIVEDYGSPKATGNDPRGQRVVGQGQTLPFCLPDCLFIKPPGAIFSTLPHVIFFIKW
ncbi:hypothetical protein GALL_430180 [mine drainage metagenome]|uniref:Uncharacterized protein n=1 Tax=mine drainage metagenome TaxID=410659 RepID=A0A1J5QH56_9ZZZZ